ncbi:MAG TPA: sensor histidine kinase [Nostocaceae cyanobacterium]|nr:sensor histidine kinase [Nostocaceae cyanobacterium]
MDFGQLLAEKTDFILERWIAAIRKDQRIESTDGLSHTAIQNHIPDVLKAMTTVLSQTQDDDIKSVVIASWEHGKIRALQGFNPVEITREYHQLRMVIFETITTDLLEQKPSDLIRCLRLIDVVIDEAIAQCFYNYVTERLKELQQLHSTLTKHNEELTYLIQTNHEHLSKLAHDLKRPLTSIIGYSDLLLRQQKQKNANHNNIEHIERVLRNGQHLLKLINNLLEISRYDTGNVKLELAPTDVCELINNTCEILHYQAAEKNLLVVTECSHAPDQLITDHLKLQQILTNLLSNAIRYTESGAISVLCQVLDNEQWEIAVTDTGIGITTEDQQHIFEPFYRPTNQKYRLPDSTGLSLAIVSRLVKLLQGEIKVNSQLGLGSTFSVILPLNLKIPEE